MDTAAISFRASDVDRDKLKDLLARHFDYERARLFRSTVIWRLTTIVVVVWGLSRGAHLLPGSALDVTCLIAVGASILVVLFEQRARSRLRHEVSDLHNR